MAGEFTIRMTVIQVCYRDGSQNLNEEATTNIKCLRRVEFVYVHLPAA